MIGSQRCYLFTNRTIFCSNHIFFSANENGTVKQNNQSDFKAFLNSPITLQENKRQKSHCLANLATLLGSINIGPDQNLVPILCDLKMDLTKWQLNLVTDSNRTRAARSLILKSRV